MNKDFVIEGCLFSFWVYQRRMCVCVENPEWLLFPAVWGSSVQREMEETDRDRFREAIGRHTATDFLYD